MQNTVKINYEETYIEYEKSRYLDYLSSLSDSISFDDDTWICDKRIKSKAQLLSKVTIYFSKIPREYKEMTKFFALIRLINGISLISVNQNISHVALFLDFLEMMT